MAVTADIYLYAKLHIGKGAAPRIDLDDANAGAFKAVLLTSAYTPALTTHDFLNDIAGEVTTNGASRLALTGVSWAINGSVIKFNCTSPIQWTASGGLITARYMVIYYDGGSPANDGERELLMLIDYGADQSAGDGTAFRVNVNASGLFTLG